MARYALVVGISQYEEPFKMLSKATIDANAVANLLSQDKRYKNVELLTDEVTGTKLAGVLKTFLQEQAIKNEALIYFTGHGFTIADIAGETEGYLATSDCSVKVQDNRFTTQERALPLNTLNKLIQNSDLSNLVVLLDACHSGTFLEQNLVKQSFNAFVSRIDYYLITGCRGFEKGITKKREKHSVFTEALLDGLSQNNADKYGKITGDRLFDFIYTELSSSNQEPIRMGIGRSISLIKYPSKTKAVTALLDEKGEVICPYQGLQAFKRDQKEFFFGRRRVVENIKRKLDQSNFVPVIGASGSGKSSVIRAGLIPWLEELGWQVLPPIKPGLKPLKSLECAFENFFQGEDNQIILDNCINDEENTQSLLPLIKRLPDSKKFLLVIDQFEELFTFSQPSQRERFIHLITQTTGIPDSQLAITITMRADFLEPFVRYPALHQLIAANHTEFMPPLNSMELSEIIIAPAKRQGYQLNEDLLQAIDEDVSKEPGFLPLLEFALTKLWEKRDEGKHELTLAEYVALGRLPGALNQHANRVYQYRDYEEESPKEERDEAEKDWIRRIFLQLVRTGEGGKDTRQRQPKVKLLSIVGDDTKQRDAFNKVLDAMVRGRLLTAGIDREEDNSQEALVDLAHESLMKGWDQFVSWRQQNWDLLRLRDRLEDALREWLKNRNDENLMMGGLLAQVRSQWNTLKPYLQSPVEDENFYQLSDAHEQDRIAKLNNALDEAQQSEIKSLCKSSDALFASGQKLDALVESLRSATKLQLQKKNWSNTDPLLEVEVVSTLGQAVFGVYEHNRLDGHSAPVWNVSFSPDGKSLASASADYTIKLWTINGQLLQTISGHDDDVTSVSFNPSDHGKTLISASEDNTVKLWNTDGKLLKTFKGHTDEVWSVSFSPDGKTFASASYDCTVKLWNIDSELLKTFVGHTDKVSSVSFNPNLEKTMVASAGWDNTVRLWNLDGQELKTLAHDGVVSVSFSPDGKTLASASWNKTIKLWSVEGELLKEIPADSDAKAHDAGVTNVSFSPDGKTLASTSEDTKIKLWSVEEGQLLYTFQNPNASWVRSVSFSLDGKTLATSGDDQRITLWNLDEKLKTIRGHSKSVWGLSFSKDGKTLASSSEDKTVRLWSINGQPQKILDDLGGVWNVRFSPNGEVLASSGEDLIVKLWSIEGQLLQTLQGHDAEVWGIRFSSDSKILASASYDTTVKLWSVGGQLLRTLLGHTSQVNDVSFSPNDEILVSASSDKTIKLWSAEGQLLQTLQGHTAGVISVCFSLNGETLVSASADKTVKLWSANGQLLQTLQGHSAGVNSVCFSPNANVLASASADKTVRLWSVEGQLLKILKGHSAGIMSVCFSPDGKTLASASEDKTIVLWDLEHLNLKALMVRGCDWVRDYLWTNPNVEESDRHLCNEIDRQSINLE